MNDDALQEDDTVQEVEAETPLPEDEQKVVSLFKRYAVASATSLYVPEGTALGAEDYSACEFHKRSERKKAEFLNIYRKDNTSFTLPYHLINEIEYPSDQCLCLFYASNVLTLTGRHIREISPLINEKRLMSLFCFNPAMHAMPPETEILVTDITRQTIKEFETQ